MYYSCCFFFFFNDKCSENFYRLTHLFLMSNYLLYILLCNKFLSLQISSFYFDYCFCWNSSTQLPSTDHYSLGCFIREERERQSQLHLLSLSTVMGWVVQLRSIFQEGPLIGSQLGSDETVRFCEILWERNTGLMMLSYKRVRDHGALFAGT